MGQPNVTEVTVRSTAAGAGAWAVRVAQRVIDVLLGVRGEVLNPHPAAGPPLTEVLPALRRFLAGGQVDYARLREAPAFQQYCQAVAALHHAAPPAAPEAARAWWINLYNALIIHAVIALRIRRSVWEDRGFFRRAAYRVGGLRLSADDIEHGILRGNRPHPLLRVRQFPPGDPRLRWTLPLDPRIHFALVCASRSCPPVVIYTTDGLDAQLDAAAAAFITSGGVEVNGRQGVLYLSPIFKWYAADFGGKRGVLAFVSRYLRRDPSPGLEERRIMIRYLRYDWTLNRAAPVEATLPGEAG